MSELANKLNAALLSPQARLPFPPRSTEFAVDFLTDLQGCLDDLDSRDSHVVSADTARQSLRAFLDPLTADQETAIDALIDSQASLTTGQLLNSALVQDKMAELEEHIKRIWTIRDTAPIHELDLSPFDYTLPRNGDVDGLKALHGRLQLMNTSYSHDPMFSLDEVLNTGFLHRRAVAEDPAARRFAVFRPAELAGFSQALSLLRHRAEPEYSTHPFAYKATLPEGAIRYIPPPSTDQDTLYEITLNTRSLWPDDVERGPLPPGVHGPYIQAVPIDSAFIGMSPETQSTFDTVIRFSPPKPKADSSDRATQEGWYKAEVLVGYEAAKRAAEDRYAGVESAQMRLFSFMSQLYNGSRTASQEEGADSAHYGAVAKAVAHLQSWTEGTMSSAMQNVHWRGNSQRLRDRISSVIRGPEEAPDYTRASRLLAQSYGDDATRSLAETLKLPHEAQTLYYRLGALSAACDRLHAVCPLFARTDEQEARRAIREFDRTLDELWPDPVPAA